MAGPIPDQDYFAARVKPLLGKADVELVGELDDHAKNDLIGNAAGFLVPIQWDEPFGLVFIEALATGTPVISCPRGSLPELMEPGRHGFLEIGEKDLASACAKVSGLDRAECRRWVLERFAPGRMAADYERVYRGLITPDRARATQTRRSSQLPERPPRPAPTPAP
jgi:glycosyltransferase involved in cell wall biosynthesis